MGVVEMQPSALGWRDELRTHSAVVFVPMRDAAAQLAQQAQGAEAQAVVLPVAERPAMEQLGVVACTGECSSVGGPEGVRWPEHFRAKEVPANMTIPEGHDWRAEHPCWRGAELLAEFQLECWSGASRLPEPQGDCFLYRAVSHFALRH
jgi:hypothetical protein